MRMSRDARPIAVLGGGAYAARLVELAGACPGMPALELRLHGRDPGRLATIAGHAARRLAAIGAPHRAIACPDLDAALDGVTAVVLMIRVGGLAARAHDEDFPARFELVGDEGVGVGGMANAWRTLPVLGGVLARIAAIAPRARVLNLMAPLGVTTRLCIELGLSAVGLCELPGGTLARWTAAAGPAAAGAPPLRYAGLNHLGCFWPEAGAALDHPVVRAAIAAGDATEELVERLGAVPLHYYVEVLEPALARQLGRERRPGRAGALAELQAVLLDRFSRARGAPVAELERRPTPWLEHALVPALHAVLGGPPLCAALDLPNAGALDEAPAGVVVELAGRLDASGARFDPASASPAAPPAGASRAGPAPARPPAVRALLGRLAASEDALYRAALGRDRALLGEALDALPLPLPVPLPVPGGARARLLDAICEPVPP
jgi:6-phospho-beta-glucosidase